MSHYFLAIKIPESLHSLYQDWQSELKETLSYKKWTVSEDFHITLCFLGKATKEQIGDIVSRLEAVRRDKPFKITLGGLDRFGRIDQPRVLFTAVEPSGELQSLQKEVENVVATVGFKKEKRTYRPHLTLAKKWTSSHSLSEKDWMELQASHRQKQTFQVTNFMLYRIHPTRTPSYEVVHVFSLSK